MSRKKIFWIILAIALTIYSLVVYSWWVQGNENERRGGQIENTIPRH